MDLVTFYSQNIAVLDLYYINTSDVLNSKQMFTR